GLALLLVLLILHGIDILGEALNIKSLREPVPAGFESLFPAEKYAQAQNYGRARAVFGIISSTFSLGCLIGFWVLGGFGRLDQWVRGWGWPEIPTGLAFFTLLFLLKSFVSLPFELYSTFVIEERYGFNRTTFKTFVLDRIKGIILAAVLG